MFIGKPFIVISTLDSMARKKMCALLHKYGVTVGCIAGSTSFINQDGKEIGVGVCCWYFGNMPGAKQGVVDFSFFDNSFCTPDVNVDVNDENDIDDEDEDEDEDDMGITKLFN